MWLGLISAAATRRQCKSSNTTKVKANNTSDTDRRISQTGPDHSSLNNEEETLLHEENEAKTHRPLGCSEILELLSYKYF